MLFPHFARLIAYGWECCDDLYFRSLDKLKKQIKEAKEAKKLAREAAKKAAKGDKSGDNNTAVAAPAKGNTAEEDDLFTVKAVHSWNPDSAEPDLTVDETAGLNKGQLKKQKTMKLTRDGELKIAQQKASKISFDDDGNAVDKTIKLVNAAPVPTKAGDKAGATALVDTQRIADHAQRVKERLDQSRAEDLQREKQRIREKKLQFKLSVGNNRQKKDDGDDDGAVAFLGNAVEEDSDSDASDSGSDGDSGSEGRGVYRNDSDSDGSDVSGAGSDSEESTGFRASATKRKLPAAGSSAKGAKQAKVAGRGRARSDSDSSGSGSEDSERGFNKMDVAKDEAMVLAMLNRR
jgi:Tfp pilus assembly protein FimT